MTDSQPLPAQPAAPAAESAATIGVDDKAPLHSDAALPAETAAVPTPLPQEAPLLAPEAEAPAAIDSAVSVTGPAHAEAPMEAPIEAAADTSTASPGAPTIPDMPPAQTAARLAELFPALFTPGSFKPLKLRIQADIQQRAPGLFNRKSLSVFLHRHTTSNGYLKALANAPARVDLDGQPAGEVSDEHRQAAAAELERRRGLHEARRAAEREAQRAAHAQARRARATDPAAAGATDGAVASSPEGDGATPAAPGDRPARPPRPPREGERGPRSGHAGERGRGDANRGDANRGARPTRPDAPRGRPAGAPSGGPRSRDAHGRGPDRRPDVPRDVRSEPVQALQAGAPPRHEHAAPARSMPVPSMPPRPPMDDAQRARAHVLHAYETTTLTRANFCALKGWTDAQLEATLVEARRERELRGPAPRSMAPGAPMSPAGAHAMPRRDADRSARRGPPGGPRSPR